MRPVYRPTRAVTYPDIRLDTGANLKTDLLAVPWTTTKDPPKDYFGTPLNAEEALYGTLRELIVNPPLPPPPSPKKKKKLTVTLSQVKKYAEKFRDRTYKLSNDTLLDELGRACSYCEQRPTEGLAVEHVVPKAPYPVTSIAWPNFLLSCRPCNNQKGSDPQRTEGYVAAALAAGGYDGELAAYNAIRGHYLLPDDSTNAHHSCRPRLFYRSAGTTFTSIANDVAVSDALIRTDNGSIFNKQPRAQIPFTTGTITEDVLVYMDARQPDQTYAEASVEWFGFDRQGIGSSEDHRMWDRTNAWLTAVEEFTSLATTFKSSAFPAVWRSTVNTARASGYLTTWLQVLWLKFPTAKFPPNTATTLVEQFLQEMTQPQTGYPTPAWPSTRLDLLPPTLPS